MKRTVIALLAVSISSTSQAAGRGPFAGPRLEAIGGYDQTDTGPRLGAANGIVYGLGAGYDVQRSGLSFGIEAEANDASSRATVAGIRHGVGRSLYLGVRGGVLLANPLLLYAKGGYANGQFTSNRADGYTGSGFRVGGGAEYAVAERRFIKVEYRYSDYGRAARGQTWVIGVGLRL